jgi:hypothetical protein
VSFFKKCPSYSEYCLTSDAASKFKFQRRQDSTSAETTDILKAPTGSFQLPRARTQPYEAPYFFPIPGSPEAVDYIRKTREEKITSRPFHRHSANFPLPSIGQQQAEEDQTLGRPSVDGGMAGVSPTRIHFAA